MTGSMTIFCANKTIDEVYNEQFLEIVEAVNKRVEELQAGESAVDRAARSQAAEGH